MPKTVIRKSFRDLNGPDQLARVNGLLGGLPPLGTILEEKEATFRRHHVGRERAERRRQRTIDAYGAYKDVLEGTRGVLLAGGDVRPGALQNEHGVHFKSIVQWLNGTPPVFLSKRPREVRVVKPTTEDVDFAFLLGYVMQQPGKMPTNRLKVSPRDREDAELVGRKLAELRGRSEPYSATESGRLWKVDVNCPETMEFLNEVTAGKRRVPWEYLKTDAERRAFLRGYLSSNTGGVSQGTRGESIYPFFRLTRAGRGFVANSASFLFTDLQILFLKLGVTSSVRRERRSWMLDVYELSNLKRMLDLSLLPPRKTKRLPGLMVKAMGDRTQRSFTPRQYDAVIAHKGEYDAGVSKGFFKGVASRVNELIRGESDRGLVSVVSEVNAEDASRWLVKGQKPVCVVNRDRVVWLEGHLYGSVDKARRGKAIRPSLDGVIEELRLPNAISDTALNFIAWSLERDLGVQRGKALKALEAKVGHAIARRKRRRRAKRPKAPAMRTEFEATEADVADYEDD